jgi:SPP1 family predicted phage head-tail adaptor
MRCETIHGRRRTICAGDLDRFIEIQTRAIQGDNGVDYISDFDTKASVFAMLKTVNGVTIFDETNQEHSITHEFYVYYDDTITAQDWVLFDGVRLKIRKVEDLDGRHEWLKLSCNERGDYLNANNNY